MNCGASLFRSRHKAMALDDALLPEGGDLFGGDAQPRTEDVLDMLAEPR